MSTFPGNLPSFTDLNPDTTLAANNHAARHNSVHDEVEAIAAKVGKDSSAVTTSHDYKLSAVTGSDKAANKTTTDAHAANTSNPHSVTKSQVSLGNVDNTSDATKQAAFLLAAHPVGAVYVSVVNTSPATLFGGTWVAFGAGRVLVGIDGGQTEFDTVEETGGAKTHTLTESEMPTHTHTLVYGEAQTGAGGAQIYRHDAGSNLQRNVSNTGGGAAHNNLQPYIVVYMWKRTA